ncbi:MAG: septum formation initiator family protein [Clostridia bacterium]|nr:septum formation initiator family protein [Clostridia bacterium]
MEQKRTTPARTPAKRTGTSVSVPPPKAAKSAAPARKAAPLSRRQSKRMAHRRAVREPKFITVRKERKERKPFPLGIVLVLAMITALFLFMMMNYAEIDQYNGEIRDLQNTMAKLQNEQKKLEVRLENKDDRAAFEQFAVEQLGMVKADTLDKYIVTLSPDDKTEIMEYEDEQESGFGFLLSGLAEVVRGFFGD